MKKELLKKKAKQTLAVYLVLGLISLGIGSSLISPTNKNILPRFLQLTGAGCIGFVAGAVAVVYIYNKGQKEHGQKKKN